MSIVDNYTFTMQELLSRTSGPTFGFPKFSSHGIVISVLDKLLSRSVIKTYSIEGPTDATVCIISVDRTGTPVKREKFLEDFEMVSIQEKILRNASFGHNPYFRKIPLS